MAGYRCNGDDGYPIVDLDSDVEIGDSSEDEVDVFLHGTPEQKRRLRRQSLGQESSSEDDFEKEMAAELNQTMKILQKENNTETSKAAQQQLTGVLANEKPAVYDNIYFDSDSDEENTREEKAKKEHKILTNDELLYDPGIDDDNQKWMDRQRQQQQQGSGRGVRKRPASGMCKGKPNNPKPLPYSDAVLNCPACMSVLCLDCQRHETYKNQYRAMFVMNCDIVEGEFLEIPKKAPISKKQLKKQQRKQKRQKVTEMDNSESTSCSSSKDTSDMQAPMETESDTFQPVKCGVCTTEVGVYDQDEIYHFFNVLASYS